jgi:hypothetical protein
MKSWMLLGILGSASIALASGCSSPAPAARAAEEAADAPITVQSDGRTESFWVDQNCVWHQVTRADMPMAPPVREKIGDCFAQGFARIRQAVKGTDGRIELLVQHDPDDNGANRLFHAAQTDGNATTYSAWRRIAYGTAPGVAVATLPGGRLDVFYIVPGDPDGSFAHVARPGTGMDWADAESLGRVPAGFVALRNDRTDIYKDNDVLTGVVTQGIVVLAPSWGERFYAEYTPASGTWGFRIGELVSGRELDFSKR